MRKKIMIFATAMLTLLSASTVFAESSEEITKGLHHYGPGYQIDNGDGTISGWIECYAGIPENSYQIIDSGNKYIMKENGEALTGWYIYDPYGFVYLDPDLNGAAATGLKEFIDSEFGIDITYLFNSDGILQSEAGTPVLSDGSKVWVNTNGTVSTGWLYLGNWKMYFDPETYKAYTDKDGVVTIDGKQYLFNKDGVLVEMEISCGTSNVWPAGYEIKPGESECIGIPVE